MFLLRLKFLILISMSALIFILSPGLIRLQPSQHLPEHEEVIFFKMIFILQVSYVSNRANIYLSMKKWEEAEKDASKAIEMDPKNAKVIEYIVFGPIPLLSY